MKLLLALTLLTGCSAMAQMPCTNDCPEGPSVTNNCPCPELDLPLSALQLRIRAGQIGLSNTIPNNLYRIESSLDLINWSFVGYEFTNATGAEKVLNWTFPLEQEFFRAQDVTTNWLYEEVLAYSSTMDCFGPIVGDVDYYTDFPQWGFYVNSNTVVHLISDGTGRSDTFIEAIGRYGDYYCATNTLYVTNPPSPAYRFSFFFGSSLPSTNVDYPAILVGFQVP